MTEPPDKKSFPATLPTVPARLTFLVADRSGTGIFQMPLKVSKIVGAF
jgi:hypothetical protein